MGRAREELFANLRSHPFGRYIIFYMPLSDGVDVMSFGSFIPRAILTAFSELISFGTTVTLRLHTKDQSHQNQHPVKKAKQDCFVPLFQISPVAPC